MSEVFAWELIIVVRNEAKNTIAKIIPQEQSIACNRLTERTSLVWTRRKAAIEQRTALIHLSSRAYFYVQRTWRWWIALRICKSGGLCKAQVEIWAFFIRTAYLWVVSALKIIDVN